MKNNTIITLTIWNFVVLMCLIISYFMGKVTTGSYYLGLMGCGIWSTLISIYRDKE